MRRLTLDPRPDWQRRVEEHGLHFHTADGHPYWDESACYVFSRYQIDTIERATYALWDMCLGLVQHVIDEELFDLFLIPERFRELVDAAPVILWMTDAAGRCTYVSRGWSEFSGQRQGEAIGRGWLEAVHPDDRARVAQVVGWSQARREPYLIDYRVKRPDGTERWALDAARPVSGRPSLP